MMHRLPLTPIMRVTNLLIALLGGTTLSVQAGWESATHGVMVSGRMAFPGCAPVHYPDARKRAIIDARRNMARAKSLSVGGSEQVSGETYTRTVHEVAEGGVPPVEILEEKTITGQEGSLYCVLLGK
ncbi:hypothetical protein [Ferrovum myxofaciens]|uniref:hypothetical protein n=1 Tax=Ferrovum myxofaciens TaxID=416213 RepID=UPI001237081F|nr:hypothetical protein [Ferrovum myxofaciens]